MAEPAAGPGLSGDLHRRIHVKIRDGQVANRPIYVALAVTVDGHRDILGLWAGDGGEGAKYWLQVLTEISNRGVEDVCMVVCDGLKGLPDAIGDGLAPGRSRRPASFTCCGQSFRYAGRQRLGRDRQGAQAGLHRADRGRREERFAGVRRGLGHQVPGDRPVVGERLGRVRAVPRLRRRDPPDRLHDQRDRVASTPGSAGPSAPAGTSPTKQAALKCVYMAVMSLDPTGKGRKRWTMRWKPALNAFDIAFDGRLSAGRR